MRKFKVAKAARPFSKGACLTLVAALALANAQPAFALAEDSGPVVHLGVVVIIGTAPVPNFGNVYVDQSQISWFGFQTDPSFRTGWFSWDFWLDYKEQMETAAISPSAKADVRCNPLASDASRATTSRNDHTDRWLTAQQVFSAIKGVAGVQSIWQNIRTSPGILNTVGVTGKAFTITYADGGKEAWLIGPGTSPILDMSGTNQMLEFGDGVPKSCPSMG